jgi:hypothetical protein
MKQPRESYLLKSFLDNYEKQAAVNTLLKRNNYSIKKINAFFKAVQLPTIDKFISDQNDRVVRAMYALLTRAKANENYAIKISVMGFIRYELPYLFNPKDSMKIRRLQDFFTTF